MANTLVLLAPVSGALVPLDEVPDPVFSGKMLGEGVAVMPAAGEKTVLLAPCSGVVSQLHSAGHAITITSPEGVDVLLHIGIDTVTLKGRGFCPKVAQGAAVCAGEELIAFDLEHILQEAPSALVMMVVTNGERVAAYTPVAGDVVAGESKALTLAFVSAEQTSGAPASNAAVPNAAGGCGAAGKSAGESAGSDEITIVNPSGLHARPAAVLAGAAKKFQAQVSLHKGAASANAKSVVAVMGLDVRHGDAVRLEACGVDAATAVETLFALIESGLGETAEHGSTDTAPQPSAAGEIPQTASAGQSHQTASVAALASPAIAQAASPAAKPMPTRSGGIDTPDMYRGVPAAPGVALGTVYKIVRHEAVVAEAGRGVAHEERAFAEAFSAARSELADMVRQMRGSAEADKAAIFEAHLELLDDPELLASTKAAIAAGKSAAFAWKEACAAQAGALAAMRNELLAGRAADVRDISRRVLGHLTGVKQSGFDDIPEGAVLLAEELTPSETARLDTARVAGFCTAQGSATSHAAILARAAGIAAVAAVDARAMLLENGTEVLLNGDEGYIQVRPDAALRAQVLELSAARAKAREADAANATLPALTRDGCAVHVAGNIGAVAEAQTVAANGGDGVGLLRSEFLFLQRENAPSEAEQAAAYKAVAEALGPKRDLIVRTLDVGGDKPLAYLPLPAEENPFLGVRGIRLNLLDESLFTAQVRAVLAAAPFTRLHIMFPMVASLDEVKAAKAIVEREKAALGVTAHVAVGIMVEVPSAALLSETLAREVDFFSIGTNDLTQYTLAMDRGNPRLAALADGLHPAVLGMIALTVQGAHKAGKWVGVCGGLASDLTAVPVLLGLGVNELSVDCALIPAVKGLVRRLSMERCRVLADDALCMASAAEVREYCRVFSAEDVAG